MGVFFFHFVSSVFITPRLIFSLYFYPQSSDCTVFFFTVGEKYEPIGFVPVPGPVQLLEWSPHSHVSLGLKGSINKIYQHLQRFLHRMKTNVPLPNLVQQENRLLILCQNAHIVEVPCPDQNTLKPTKSFQLLDLPRRFFCFKSIKSQIKVSLHVSWVLSTRSSLTK